MREIRDLIRFNKRQDRDIVFYSEYQDYYDYFEGVIHKLKKFYSYITSDSKDSILSQPNGYYIKWLLTYVMSNLDCKVCIMTVPDLQKYYLKRSRKNVHYVYLFHSLASTHMMYSEGAFDHYDSILCCGPHQYDEIKAYEKLHGLKPKKLVKAGYYRIEKLYNQYRNYRKKSDGTTILVAPSWGKGNILETCGRQIVGTLLNERYNVIIRPHWETIRRNPKLVASYSRLSCKMDLSNASHESLLEADVLITDYSSISLKYALATERRVLFINTRKKVHNPNWKDLGIKPIELRLRPEIGIEIPADHLSKLSETIRAILNERADFRDFSAKLRDKYIFNFGKSSEIGAEYIRSLL